MDEAESIQHHKWGPMGTLESKAKWTNPALAVNYNFAPELDGDMLASQKNLNEAESRLGKTYELP